MERQGAGWMQGAARESKGGHQGEYKGGFYEWLFIDVQKNKQYLLVF